VSDVEVLAGEARGALRKKDALLKEALAGELEPVYRLLPRQQMDQCGCYDWGKKSTRLSPGRGRNHWRRCIG
jgi:hypothetical protein